MTTGTPYRVYGGLRFFERVEIKNALAYLRLMSNRDDDASFERVINTPTRGIGAKTIDDIRNIARDQSLSLWAAAIVLINQRSLSARATNALIGFLELIKRFDGQAEGLELFEKVKLVVEKAVWLSCIKRTRRTKAKRK